MGTIALATGFRITETASPSKNICTEWPASESASPCRKGNADFVGSSDPQALFITIPPCRLTKTKLAYEGRTLIEIAVANPCRPDNEVDNSWPAHSRGTVRPRFEVRLLITLQLRRFELFGFALILDGLFARPADYHRASMSGDEIWIFSRTLDGIEDDLEARSDRDPYQCRLRRTLVTDRAKNSQLGLPHESVQIRLSHLEPPDEYTQPQCRSSSRPQERGILAS